MSEDEKNANYKANHAFYGYRLLPINLYRGRRDD